MKQNTRAREVWCFLIVFIFSVPVLHAADLRTITIPSPCMEKSFKANVVLPKDYAKTTRRYPVIYLLHGYSGNFTVWSRITDLKKLSDKYQTIFVCPDGRNSWYFDSPFKPSLKFETYITAEVIPFIDKMYRTWSETRGRAIVGTSMGGHGALTLLAKHPDLFCGAGSISGVLDITEFPDVWELADIFGPYSHNIVFWTSVSFVGQIPLLANHDKGIILDCGTADFALAGNRKAHDLLLKYGISHEYREQPGGHSLEYSAMSIDFHAAYLGRWLKRAE